MEQRNSNVPDALDQALTHALNTPVPERYHASWRAAVEREEMQKMKPRHSNFWKAALPIAAALVLVVGTILTGNGFDPLQSAGEAAGSIGVPVSRNASTALVADESADSAMASVAETAMTYDAAPMADNAASSGAKTDAAVLPAGSKLVRTANITLVTTNFDADSESVRTMTESCGGYLESVEQRGDKTVGDDRVTYYSLRIPSDKLDSFLNGLSGVGRVTKRNETAYDRSSEYSDTAMRLQTQRAKLTRLQELMTQAADVSDLMAIESEIADTQYQIDSYESALRYIDKDVDYSQVQVTLREETPAQVAQARELTLGERISNGFSAAVEGIGRFLRDMVVFLAMCLPVVVPLAVIVLVVVLIVRAKRRKQGSTKPPEDE